MTRFRAPHRTFTIGEYSFSGRSGEWRRKPRLETPVVKRGTAFTENIPAKKQAA
ncbi:MAG: hypothetical protein WBQ89_01170 [Candidatus Acidiferrum sp.]